MLIRRSPLFAVAGAVIVLVGCGETAQPSLSTGDGAETERTLGSPAVSAAVPEPGGRFEVYFEAAGSTQAEIDVRRSQVIADCMREKGFDYQVSSLPGRPVNESRYGVALASTEGYGAAGGSEEIEVSQPDASGARADEFATALWGDLGLAVNEEVRSLLTGGILGRISIAGGCFGTASEAIFGSVQDNLRYEVLFQQLSELDALSWQHLQSSKEFVLLNAEWSNCMRGRGVTTFSSPLQAASLDWTESSRHDAELGVAAADVECKQVVDYVNRAWKIESTFQDSMILDHPELAAAVAEFEARFASLRLS